MHPDLIPGFGWGFSFCRLGGAQQNPTIAGILALGFALLHPTYSFKDEISLYQALG
jgi:hypothetical protein